MANKDLLKEAIADAKAVKEVAIANAKLALEEAFTPHLKSMLSAKLEEMDKEVDKKVDEYGYMKKYEEDDVQKEEKEDKDKMDEINLDELLAELDEEMSDADKKKIDREADAIRDDADQISKLAKDAGEDAEDIKDKVEDDKAIDAVRDDMDQISKLAKDAGEDAKDVKVSEEINEDERTDAEEEGYLDGMKDEKEDMEDEDVDLEDMSEDDLKGFIEDVIKDMVGDGTIEAGEEFVEDEVEVEDDEIEIEDEESVDVDVEIDEAKRGRKEPMTKKEKAEGDDRDYDDEAEEQTEEDRLKEALAQVNELKAELNEVNILNSKLLYSNKIFKSKNLTEDKKVKVLKAFDKASTVKEAKVIFETLNEGLVSKSTPKFNKIKGSASKATGIVSEAKKPIIESNDVYNRMRQLAGLI